MGVIKSWVPRPVGDTPNDKCPYERQKRDPGARGGDRGSCKGGNTDTDVGGRQPQPRNPQGLPKLEEVRVLPRHHPRRERGPATRGGGWVPSWACVTSVCCDGVRSQRGVRAGSQMRCRRPEGGVAPRVQDPGLGPGCAPVPTGGRPSGLAVGLDGKTLSPAAGQVPG